jgi:hypothetical protein
VRIGGLNNDVPGFYHPRLSVVRLEDEFALGEDDVVCVGERRVVYHIMACGMLEARTNDVPMVLVKCMPVPLPAGTSTILSRTLDWLIKAACREGCSKFGLTNPRQRDASRLEHPPLGLRLGSASRFVRLGDQGFLHEPGVRAETVWEGVERECGVDDLRSTIGGVGRDDAAGLGQGHGEEEV